MPTHSVLILLVNYNGAQDSLECIRSLQHLNASILIVDNGSVDDSVSRLQKAHPDIPLIETKKNLGFAGGNNIGIRWGLERGYEWILLLNNDTIVDPGLLEGFFSLKHAHLMVAKIYRYDQPRVIDHVGGIWNPQEGEFCSIGKGVIDDGIRFETPQVVDYGCGAALFVHRSVFEKVGYLEEKFFLFWEESDFCFRAKKKGIDCWSAPKAKVWHKISSSFTGGKPHTHYFWWRSRLLFLQRNCTPKERRALYRKKIFPELFKTLRHFCIRSLFSFRSLERKKDKAALLAVLHFARRRFGGCPASLTKK